MFKYLGTTLTYQIYNHKDRCRRLFVQWRIERLMQRSSDFRCVTLLIINECYTPSSEPYRATFSYTSSLSLFPVAPILEHRASVKRFVSGQFLSPKTVGRTSWMGISPSQGRHLYKHRQTYVSLEGFEPTIPAFERAKTIDALDTRPLWPAVYIINH
jgi:hypothetical protein